MPGKTRQATPEVTLRISSLAVETPGADSDEEAAVLPSGEIMISHFPGPDDDALSEGATTIVFLTRVESAQGDDSDAYLSSAGLSEGSLGRGLGKTSAILALLTEDVLAGINPRDFGSLFDSYNSLIRSSRALGEALQSAAPHASPQLARATQARENLYDEISSRFGLLTSTEAGKRLGSRAAKPANAAIQARENRRLLALHRGRYVLFPGFQFAPDGKPLEVIKLLRDLAAEYNRSETGLVEWLSVANNQFGGEAPAEYLSSDPDRVLRSARNAFGVSW